LPYKTISEKVNCGDYALQAPQDKKIYIERKSLNDFIGTLSVKNFERFEKEIQRAVETDSYLIMLVESKIEQALSFHNLFFAKKYVKVTPEHIFHNLRELLSKYPLNFQALFVDGRIEASQKIIKIFELGEQVKNADLQFYYEKGEL
jgi:ERCC4-type nuclease